MVYKQFCLLVLIMLLNCISLYASKLVHFSGNDKLVVEAPYLEIKSQNAWKNFVNEQTSWPAITPIEARFFISATNKNTLFLEFPDNKLESVFVEVLDKNGKQICNLNYKDENGYTSPFSVKNQVLSFTPPIANEVYTVHYQLFSHNVSYPICWVLSAESFTSRFNAENTWYGLLAGIVLTVVLLNVFMFVNTREKIFVFYAIYAFCLGLFQWAYTGLGYQWLWSDFYLWNRISNLVCSFLLMSSQFVYLYFYVRKIKLIEKQFIVAIIVFRFLVLIISLLLPKFSLWHPLLDAFTIAYQLVLMYRANLFKSLHGSLYLTSIIILELAYLTFIAAYYQLLETNFITYNAIAFGGIAELVIGMFAIALRYKYLIQQKQNLQKQEIETLQQNAQLREQLFEEISEKQRIQTEINKALEIKVTERTQELAQKNAELEELYKRWEQISSNLDKQNWQLNRQLESDRLKLMWGKGVDFKGFQEIFQSDDHVIKFIADIKWKGEYQCKKCAHTQYMKGAQYLSRKCTKCKYEESATAGTLFHGVRFPLVKALYISLQTVLHRDTYTVQQIAKEIDLREATLWAFRKKILQELEIISKKSPHGDMLTMLILGGE